jgi:hypothetical protein
MSIRFMHLRWEIRGDGGFDSELNSGGEVLLGVSLSSSRTVGFETDSGWVVGRMEVRRRRRRSS